MLFSATLPAGAEKVAMAMLQDPVRIVVGLKCVYHLSIVANLMKFPFYRDTPLPLITQSLTYVADDPSKLPSLLTYFSQPYNPLVLIFTSTQTRATSLAEELVLNGISNVDCLHAGLTQKEREDALSRMRKGESWIMITTEIMARGMDFKGVREVINYDFPTSVQSYVHRIGRTGRAGREGKAVTFFTDDDAPYLKMYVFLFPRVQQRLIFCLQDRQRDITVWVYRAGLDFEIAQAFEIEKKTDGQSQTA